MPPKNIDIPPIPPWHSGNRNTGAHLLSGRSPQISPLPSDVEYSPPVTPFAPPTTPSIGEKDSRNDSFHKNTMAKLAADKSFSSTSFTDESSGVPLYGQQPRSFQNDSSTATSQQSRHGRPASHRRMKSDLGRTDPGHTLMAAHKQAFPVSKSIWPKTEDDSPVKRQLPSRSRSSTNVLSGGLQSIWSPQTPETPTDMWPKVGEVGKTSQRRGKQNTHIRSEDDEVRADVHAPRAQSGTLSNDLTRKKERTDGSKFLLPPVPVAKVQSRRDTILPALSDVAEEDEQSPMVPSFEQKSHAEWQPTTLDTEGPFVPQFFDGHPTPSPSAQQFLESGDRTLSSDNEQQLQLAHQTVSPVGSVSCNYCERLPRYTILPCGHMLCFQHGLEWLEREQRPDCHYVCAWCLVDVDQVIRNNQHDNPSVQGQIPVKQNDGDQNRSTGHFTVEHNSFPNATAHSSVQRPIHQRVHSRARHGGSMGSLSPTKQMAPEILASSNDQHPKSRLRRSNTSPVRRSFDPQSREFVPVQMNNMPSIFQNSEHVFRPNVRAPDIRFQPPSVPQHHNASLSANDRIRYMKDANLLRASQASANDFQNNGMPYGSRLHDQHMTGQRREGPFPAVAPGYVGHDYLPSGIPLGVNYNQGFGSRNNGMSFGSGHMINNTPTYALQPYSGFPIVEPLSSNFPPHFENQAIVGPQGPTLASGGFPNTEKIDRFCQLYGPQYQSGTESGHFQAANNPITKVSGNRIGIENQNTVDFQSSARTEKRPTPSTTASRRRSSKVVRHSASNFPDTRPGDISSSALPQASTTATNMDIAAFCPPSGPADQVVIIDGPHTQNALQYRPGIPPYTQFQTPAASIRELVQRGKVLLNDLCDIQQSPLKFLGASKPHNYSVVKINNVPFETTKQDILSFIGRTAQVITEDIGVPIHITQDRTTAKTQECYIEFFCLAEAANMVNNFRAQRDQGRPVRLRGRNILVELSTQSSLMQAMFPKATNVSWNGHLPNLSYDQIPQFQGFIHAEELSQLVMQGNMPQKVAWVQCCLQRPFEDMISILAKYPWHATTLVFLQERDRIFDATAALLRSLRNHLSSRPSHPAYTQKLYTSLLYAGLNAPGFTECQRVVLVSIQNSGPTPVLSSFAASWPFSGLGRRAETPDDWLAEFMSIIREATNDNGSGFGSVVTEAVTGYNPNMSLAMVGEGEWAFLATLIRYLGANGMTEK